MGVYALGTREKIRFNFFFARFPSTHFRFCHSFPARHWDPWIRRYSSKEKSTDSLRARTLTLDMPKTHSFCRDCCSIRWLTCCTKNLTANSSAPTTNAVASPRWVLSSDMSHVVYGLAHLLMFERLFLQVHESGHWHATPAIIGIADVEADFPRFKVTWLRSTPANTPDFI